MSNVILQLEKVDNHLEMKVTRDDYTFFIFCVESVGHALYLGPILTTKSECTHNVTYDEYRAFFNAFFKAVLIDNCIETRDNNTLLYTAKSIHHDTLNKCESDDWWEWTELLNNTGIRGLNAHHLYNYFLSKPNSLKGLAHLISYDVIATMIKSVYTCFSELHGPNKDLRAINELIKKPCDIELSQG